MTKKKTLRPITDISKEIEHNGRKFIPLERLLYMANSLDESDLIRFTEHYDLTNPIITNDGVNHYLTYIKHREDDTEDELCFGYDISGSFFINLLINGHCQFYTYISHQLHLFDLLKQWNFDVYYTLDYSEIKIGNREKN